MGKVIFFPDNKLGVSVERIFNGHIGVITQNTDRMIDGKFALAELNAFKYDIQHTTFLNPYGSDGFSTSNNENTNYGETIKKVHETGRISMGIYFRTDSWYNIAKNRVEIIPSYSSEVWSQAAVDAGFNVTVGSSKQRNFPNHGQQLYDISNGLFGYDSVNGIIGDSNLEEVNKMAESFIDYFRNISGLRLTNISYTNGQQSISQFLKPFFLGGRNSSYSWNGDSNIDFNPTRPQAISKPSSTRTWDAERAGQFVDQNAALLYMQGEIDRALVLQQWWIDFMHDHSLYNVSDTQFFELFYSKIREIIGSRDAWMAGYGEALEYLFLRDNVINIGSYENNGKINISIWVRDGNKETDTNGISDSIDMSLLKTPISVRLDLTGTSLAGKDIKCEKAHSMRKLGSNQWIINIPFLGFGEFGGVEIEEGNQYYYNENTPSISVSGNTLTSNIPCKFVVWRKADSEGIDTMVEINRLNEFSDFVKLEKTIGFEYYVGAISESNRSTLIEIR